MASHESSRMQALAVEYTFDTGTWKSANLGLEDHRHAPMWLERAAKSTYAGSVRVPLMEITKNFVADFVEVRSRLRFLKLLNVRCWPRLGQKRLVLMPMIL